MLDKVEIYIKAGRGGDGVVSFNREKFHPLGGPDGGDGGSGGSVYLQADEGIDDLSGFRQKRFFKAEDGKAGGKNKKHGRDGTDNIIGVPVGTSVEKVENVKNRLIADLMQHKQRMMAARGGRGGLGNVHYKTSTNQAPRKAGSGDEGEEIRLLLEYRIPADICIIGLPNSGKSTLLSRMTAATPKIADYPFTTVEVVIGETENGKKLFTVAEMPALIAGAGDGRGLGNEFLRHCMRARALVLLIDGTSVDIYHDIDILRRELQSYSKDLAYKTQILVINKVDLENVQQRMDVIRQGVGTEISTIFFASAREGSGVNELREELEKIVQKETTAEVIRTEEDVVFHPKPLSRRKAR